MKIINDIAKEFRVYLAKNFDYQGDAAIFFGCSPQFVSDVARGRKSPNEEMLEAMGVEKEKVTIYKKK